MLCYSPAVFAVQKDYQIIVTTKRESFISIKVGNEIFEDDSNGIKCSAIKTHNIEIPQELLNKEKHYTVIERPIIKRLPYFTKTKDEIYYEYDFHPVPEQNPKCYHIADAHNDTVKTVAAAKTYGEFDFLILNGDVPEDSGKTSNFSTIFEIISKTTEGTKPVVFTRGNHDLRGVCAELFAQYAPKKDGKTYYSFRLGNIWGLCLDCGEDKTDDHAEYGHTVACHQFRLKETAYIKKIINNAETEYDEEDIKTKIIVVHIPFTHKDEPPFDIEEDIYKEWASLLKENVKPDLMICGHTHKKAIYPVGCDYDTYGQPCTVIVGADKSDKHFTGAGIEFRNNECEVIFTRNDGNKDKPEIIEY